MTNDTETHFIIKNEYTGIDLLIMSDRTKY
jgi:hypothetical protein